MHENWRELQDRFRRMDIVIIGRLVGIYPGSQRYYARIGFTSVPNPGKYKLASFDGLETIDMIIAHDFDDPGNRYRPSQYRHPIRSFIVDSSKSPKRLLCEAALSAMPTRTNHILYPAWETTIPECPIYVRLHRTEFDPAIPEDRPGYPKFPPNVPQL